MHAAVAEFLEWKEQQFFQGVLHGEDACNGGIGELEADIKEQVRVDEQQQERRGAEVVEGVVLPMRHVAYAQ